MADEAYAPGDSDRDGFDESQGCYFVKATKSGHCRFTIIPPAGKLVAPVFRVAGPWKDKVRVSAVGLGVQNVTVAADGSALFVLPGQIRYPMAVEVTGKLAPSDE